MKIFVLFFVVCFGILTSGSVNAMAANAMNDRNHYQNRDDSIVFADKVLIIAYNTGVDKRATHMLIVWNWNFEEPYQYIVFVYPRDDLSTELNYYNTPGYYSVVSVYEIDGKHVRNVEDLQERLIHINP